MTCCCTGYSDPYTSGTSPPRRKTGDHDSFLSAWTGPLLIVHLLPATHRPGRFLCRLPLAVERHEHFVAEHFQRCRCGIVGPTRFEDDSVVVEGPAHFHILPA